MAIKQKGIEYSLRKVNYVGRHPVRLAIFNDHVRVDAAAYIELGA